MGRGMYMFESDDEEIRQKPVAMLFDGWDFLPLPTLDRQPVEDPNGQDKTRNCATAV